MSTSAARVVNSIPLHPEGVAVLEDVGAALGAPVETLADRSQIGAGDVWAPGRIREDVEGLIGVSVPNDLSLVPRLRWLQITSSGVEHLDLRRIADAGITLTNASGIQAVAMGEYSIGWLLHVAKGMHDHLRNQRQAIWPPVASEVVGDFLRGTTLLVVGYGSVGREVARLASAFGMRILAVKARPEVRRDEGYFYPGCSDPDGTLPEAFGGAADLPELAREADFVLVALPNTARTRGLVSGEAIAAMRSGAWLINIGRGPTVDTAALEDALERKAIGGAVLDVFDEEPLPAANALWNRPNVIVTPHVSGGGWRTYHFMVDLFVTNLRRFAAGEPLLNVVDPERGY